MKCDRILGTGNWKGAAYKKDFGFQITFFLILLTALVLTGCTSRISVSSQESGDLKRTGLTSDAEAFPESGKGRIIRDISMTEASETTDVQIKGNRLLAYTSVKQPSPLAIILYFSETSLDPKLVSDPDRGFEQDISESHIVSSIKASELTENGHTSRIEILLKKDAPYDVTREDTGIKISFVKSDAGKKQIFSKKQIASHSAVKSWERTGFPPRRIEERKKPALEVWNPALKSWVPEYEIHKPASKISTRFPPATRVQSVYATRRKDGLKVFVGADGAITNYKAFTIDSPARIVFDIFNIKSPYKKEKRVPVNSKWVKRVRYYAYPDRLRVVLDTKKAYLSAFVAMPVENGLEIHVGSNIRDDSQLPAAIYPSATRLQSVYASQQEHGTVVTVRGDGPITNYKTSVTETPPRIIFDISNVFSDEKTEKTFPVDTQWVKRVRYKVISSPAGRDSDKLQIVIDTQKAYLSAFSAIPDKDGLVIRVGSPLRQVQGTAQGAGALLPSPFPVPKQTISGKPANANLIVFVPEEAGKSSLIIETSRQVTYDIVKTADKKLELKLFDTEIPDHRYKQGALITTHFESAVNRITPIRRPGLRNTSLFEIDLREAVPYFVEQITDDSGRNLVMVHFEASSIPPESLVAQTPPSTELQGTGETSLEVTGPESELKVTETETETPAGQAGIPDDSPPAPSLYDTSDMGQPPSAETDLYSASPAPLASEAPSSDIDDFSDDEDIAVPDAPKKYTGEKIALDFFETDIKNVFRILREVSGKNFAIDNNVSGKVTLTLEHPVPWDQVLDLILKMNQLGRTYEGDIIRIATIKTIQYEEKVREERKLAEQSLKEQKKALEPLLTEYIAINYSNAKKEILPHIKEILTEKRGTASVDDRTNMVIMTDTAEKIGWAKEIVEKLDRVTPQVLIEARIVEVSSNFSRGFGTKWGAKGGIQEDASNAGTGPQRSYDLFGGTYGYEMAMDVAVPDVASIGFNFMRIAGTPLALNAKLMAMESLGELRIVSAPKIVTLDNKRATIRQGISYPYQTVDDGKIKTTFKDVDLLLEVIPHVTPDSRISMTINITKNDLGKVISGEQSFDKKEAKTELLVNDGDTVVIGGIIKSTERGSTEGIPGLSKIPLLGWLFKSKTKGEDKEELLIFITPTIIQLEQRHTQY